MQSKRTIKLLLVDDHSVVRMGLSAVLSLEEDFAVVGEAEDGVQAIEQFETKHPDVVLMDVRMPVMGGVDALRTLVKKFPGIRILMLTTSELDDDVQHALDAGARGYLLKSVTRDELVRGIRQVHAGERCVPHAIEQRMRGLAQRRQLSEREAEVLDGMRRGLSNREIAQALSISEHTVKTHVKAILQKLESADRAEAVARGYEQGLLRVDTP